MTVTVLYDTAPEAIDAIHTLGRFGIDAELHRLALWHPAGEG